jgi:hypothetical protein
MHHRLELSADPSMEANKEAYLAFRTRVETGGLTATVTSCKISRSHEGQGIHTLIVADRSAAICTTTFL